MSAQYVYAQLRCGIRFHGCWNPFLPSPDIFTHLTGAVGSASSGDSWSGVCCAVGSDRNVNRNLSCCDLLASIFALRCRFLEIVFGSEHMDSDMTVYFDSFDEFNDLDVELDAMAPLIVRAYG